MDSEFLHILIHDLKGPVSRVRMLSELLSRKASSLDEESQRLMSHIDTSAASAQLVLEALQRYADVVGLKYRPAHFDLSHAAAGAVYRLQAQISATGAAVEYSELPEVHGDATQIGILFQELIANSLRCRSAAPPRLEIAATGQAGGCLIAVRDNGTGLGNSDLERIFRPFGKSSSSGKPGIGLAISRHIARVHGGTLTAVALPTGAEFRLFLPTHSA